MTITVNLQTAEEEKALINFLEQMHFDYQSESDGVDLTEEQKQEILRRDADYIAGKTTARDWEDIKRNPPLLSFLA